MACDAKENERDQKTECPTDLQSGQSVGEIKNSPENPKKKFWPLARAAVYRVFSPFCHLDSVGFFTAVLCFVAWLQWQTLEKTDHTLKDTLASHKLEQRAWVTVDYAIGSVLNISK